MGSCPRKPKSRIPSASRPSRSRRRRPDGRFSFNVRMVEVTLPSLCGPTRVRAGGCASAASPPHARRTENSNLSGCPPNRFPTGAGALAGSFSAESGRHDLHAVRRALVSSEAQHPGWFTLHGAPGGGRTLIPVRVRPSEDRASSGSATGAWSGRRDLNSPYDHGEVACCR